MEIFFRLLFGHLLADFTFQTNYIAQWKRNKFIGLLVHVGFHPLFYTALTWPYINDVWRTYGGIILSGRMCVILASLIHFAQDWFRVAAINRGWSDNTLFYIQDQAVHIASLWFLSPIAGQTIQNSWPILGVLFVLVTHCATVTIWFIEKDLRGREFPETEEKYISILQRLVVWLSFFLPHPWWVLVLLFVLVSFGRHVWTRRIDFSWPSVLMGNAIAILCGTIARFGLHFHL